MSADKGRDFDGVVRVGDLVKFRLFDSSIMERVWGEVLSVDLEKKVIKVRIDNQPTSPAFKLHEEIELPIRFIIEQIMKEDVLKNRRAN